MDMNNKDYKSIIQKSPIGYAYHKIICDEGGMPCDYEFIELNSAFERFTGLMARDVIGRRVTEVLPGIVNGSFDWIKTYGDIALKGGSKQFEQFSQVLNRWYSIYAYSPMEGYFITWATDITEKTEELERFFNINLDLLCIADMDGNFIKVNNAWEKILGYSAIELEKRKFLEFVHPEDIKATLDAILRLSNDEQVLYFVNRYKCMDTTYRYIEWCSQPYKGLIYAAARDITDRKLTEEALRISEERFDIAVKGTKAGLWDWDIKNNTVYYSPQWKSMLGYEQDEVENTFNGWKSLWHPEDALRIEQAINDYITGKTEQYETSHRLRCKNGNWRWILTRGEALRDANGKPYRWIGTNIDITDIKEAEEKVIYLSFHDQLTGLYNRRFYEEELNRLDVERNLPLSLIMADVNGLKLANDAFGHLLGDKLIKKAAEVIKNECRADDIVSRIGGDEFVIILPKTDSHGAEYIVKRIEESAENEKVEVLDLSVSFGWATKIHHGEAVEDIFNKAEDNMYKQKLHKSPNTKNKAIKTILSRMHERFPEERKHSERVSKLCKSIGLQLGLSKDDIEVVKIAGLLHDIGKVTLNAGIIMKPEKLNDIEWIEVKRHSETGYLILGSVNNLAHHAKYVLHHHERWDGSGYPDGLKGVEIPLQSRIIGIADAYDAMRSNRSYRKALSKKEAIQEIKGKAGTQFDPNIAKEFVDNILKPKPI